MPAPWQGSWRSSCRSFPGLFSEHQWNSVVKLLSPTISSRSLEGCRQSRLLSSAVVLSDHPPGLCRPGAHIYPVPLCCQEMEHCRPLYVAGESLTRTRALEIKSAAFRGVEDLHGWRSHLWSRKSTPDHLEKLMYPRTNQHKDVPSSLVHSSQNVGATPMPSINSEK